MSMKLPLPDYHYPMVYLYERRGGIVIRNKRKNYIKIFNSSDERVHEVEAGMCTIDLLEGHYVSCLRMRVC